MISGLPPSQNEASLLRHVLRRSGSELIDHANQSYFLLLFCWSVAGCPAVFVSCCGVVGCLLPPFAMIGLLWSEVASVRHLI